jgi:aspartate racemase
MKTIGIIGGLSWFSTSIYYKTINELTNARLGGSYSAKILMYSFNFDEFAKLLEKNDWNEIENTISTIAKNLENAGADCIIIATNTPHVVAEGIMKKIQVPLIHIAEETAKEIVAQKIHNVALLGTKFTMEKSFFKDRLTKYGISTIVPDDLDRLIIHEAIFNELTKGIFTESTKLKYLNIINKLHQQGAQGIIFGCTEIALLINQSECPIPVFDTATIHAKAAVDFALK